ncbi:MAG: hypothetical protein AABX51_08180 [Nanoarchaeota archaeon]
MADSRLNIKFGWLWIFFGIVSGMILGMFAFNGPLQLPPEFMDYSSLPRRFLRLAHISFLGLGFLNWMYGISAKTLSLKIDKNISYILIFGSITMPLILILSAFFEPIKYALIIPAGSIFLGVLMFCKALCKD